MPAPTPPVIPEPFAESGDRATIPDISGVTGRADWRVGFPAITMEAKIAGGIPPDGRDFNGIYWAISAHAFYAQGGQPYKYSTDISAAIGSYALGAMIGSADAKTLWYNNVNSNATDPDTDNSGWVSAFTYGSITISGLTGGTRTLTRLESRFGLIILTGTLTSNQAIVFPNDKTDWRIVNNTTGAFTVTARTGSGTGVVVPQGDFSTSTEIYGNGTDIFFSVPPISLPISVTVVPNTLLMRDNLGDGFVRYINSSSIVESLTITNVVVTNNADGYFRKIAFTALLAQAFNNAALTGAPTAPTPAAGDNSTKIATTAFVNGLGVGGTAQTWQSVIGSRSLNTTYTNTTGLPIAVSVSTNLNATGDIILYINGVEIGRMDGGSPGATEKNQMFGIVPAGNTYQVAAGSGTTVYTWAELR